MTDLLRDHLARIADAAPDLAVPADTWQRGRRARTRARIATATALATALALLGGVAWVSAGGTHRADPAEHATTPGVPSTLWSVPDRLTGAADERGRWPDGLETDLAVGPASVAFVAGHAVPVVVGADDGAYHLLRLPGLTYDGAYRQTAWSPGRWLALSPDGTRLAWSAPPDQPGPFGLRVLDLASGTVREVATAGRRVDLSITWSPDAQWLAWGGSDDGAAYVGRVHVHDWDAVETPHPLRGAAVAVGDDGVVQLIGPRRHLVWDGVDAPRPARALPSTGPLQEYGAVSPSGRWVALVGTNGTPVVVDADTGQAVDVSDGGSLQSADALGWVDDTHAVFRAVGPGRSDGSILVVGPVDGESRTRAASAIWIQGEHPRSMSLATAFMAADRLSVERPEPDWPMSGAERARIWLLVGGAAWLLLLLGWRRWYLRRRVWSPGDRASAPTQPR